MRNAFAKMFAVASLSLLFAVIAVTEDLKFLDDRFQQQDLVTIAGPTGKAFKFCWVVKPCDDCVQPYNIQFRKYRVEGGMQYMGKLLHVSEWALHATHADGSKEYCAVDNIPRAGHWVYEARMCGPPPDPASDPVCVIGTSTDPEAATVVLSDGTSAKRAWWMYTFLASPGTPEVDMRWWNVPRPGHDKEVVPEVIEPKEVMAHAKDR